MRNFEMKPDKSNYDMHLEKLQKRFDKKLKLSGSKSLLSLMALGLSGCGASTVGQFTSGQFTSSGTGYKGPLSNATVFIDLDDDGVLDSGEISTLTDVNGKFSFSTDDESLLQGNIILTTNENTVDASSGEQLSGLTLKATNGSDVVSPATTLIKQLVDGGDSLEQAETTVQAALGIDEDIDLSSFNPFETTNLEAAKEVEAAAQKIVAIVNTVSSAAEAGGADKELALEAALGTIAEAIDGSTGSLNLSDTSATGLISKVITAVDAATGTSTDTTLVNAIANVNEAIDTVVENAETLDDARETFSIAQSTLLDAAEATVNGDTYIATQLGSTSDATQLISIAEEAVSAKGTKGFVNESDEPITLSGVITLSDPDATDGIEYRVKEGSASPVGSDNILGGTLTVGADGEWTYKLDVTTDADKMALLQELQSKEFKGDLSKSDISPSLNNFQIIEKFEVQIEKVDTNSGLETPSVSDALYRDGSTITKVITVVINGDNDAVVSTETKISDLEDVSQGIAIADIDTSKFFSDKEVEAVSSSGGASGDGDVLLFSASGLPEGLTLNAETGVISGTPSSNTLGVYEVVVTATDIASSTASQSFKITIVNVNDTPVVTADIADTITDEDDLFTLDISSAFDDADIQFNGVLEIDETLTFSATLTDGSALPNWISLNSSTGVFTGTPSNDDVGNLELTVTATDVSLASVTNNFTITVSNTNDDPTASTKTGDTIGDSNSINIDASYLAAEIADVDASYGDTLTVTNVSVQSGGGNVAETSVGSGVWTYTPPDVSNDTAVVLEYTVSDKLGANATADIELNVVDALPIGSINEDGVIDIDDMLAAAADVLKVDVSDLSIALASDPDTNLAEGSSYAPAQDINGAIKFVIKQVDADNLPAVLEIKAVDDAAVVNGDISKTVDEDNDISGTLAGTDVADGLSDGTLWTVESDASNGAASIDAATGEWSYTPTANFNGTDKFTVTLTDDDGHTLNQDVSITVSAVNDTAVITGDTTKTVDEDNDISGTLAGTDVADGLSDGTLWTVESDASNGAASIDAATGEWSYTPTANFNGTDKFTVTLTDDDGHTLNQDVSITVSAVNDTAVITGDTAKTGDEDNDISGTLSGTDAADGLIDGTLWTVESDASNGAASIDAATGEWSYTPTANFNGTDKFTVTLTDDDGHTLNQDVSITVSAVNDTPVVTADIADTITDEDDLFTLDISSAFDDADIQFNGVLEIDETLTFSATLTDGSALPNWISLNSSTGVFTGTPSNDDVGNLELTVTATDVSLASVTNNFTITVSNTNDDPTASTKTGDTIGDSNSINIDASYLAAEIADVDASYGDTLTVTNVSVQSGGGNVAETSVGSGVWTYTPPDVSNDTAVVLEYTVSDKLGANATADIELNVVDALPIGSINEDGVIDIDDMLAAAADVLKVDVSDLSIALASDPDTNLAEGSSYAPAQDINGAIKFVIKQVDADNLPAVLEIKAVDDAAVVSGDISKSDAEDKVISGTLAGTDVADGLSDGTLWTVASDASNGAASIDAATGEWSYTPTANFNGTDKFTVTLTDDDGHTLNQDVSVTVSAVDDPAVITGETAKTVDEDNDISGTLAGTDVADGLSDGTLWTVESDASNGAASIDAATGEWSYTPTANFNGTDKFTVTLTDDDGHTLNQDVSITVSAVDDAAVIIGDTTKTGDEDNDISGTLSGTDAADGLIDGTLWTVANDASNGAASIDAATGEWSYTPTANFNGTDKFTVTLTDDDGHTLNQDVSITVSAVDDAAVITGETAKTGDEDNDISGTLSGTDTADGLSDGTLWTVASDASNGAASINAATGEWSYTPAANFNGTDKFTVTLTDDDGNTSNQDVSVTVLAVDDATVITGDTTGSGTQYSTDIKGQLEALDPEGLTDGSYFSVSTDAKNGAAAIDAETGEWTYTPTLGAEGGLDQFVVTVTDDLDGVFATTIDINIATLDNAITASVRELSGIEFGGETGVTATDYLTDTYYAIDLNIDIEAYDMLTDVSTVMVTLDHGYSSTPFEAISSKGIFEASSGAQGVTVLYDSSESSEDLGTFIFSDLNKAIVSNDSPFTGPSSELGTIYLNLDDSLTNASVILDELAVVETDAGSLGNLILASISVDLI